MTSPINITPQQAYDWLVSGEAILVDVREPDEFKAEHITYATSMPLALMCDTFAQANIPTERKVIFQCLSGKRGEMACALLTNNESTRQTYNIQGGIHAWKAAGLPLVTSRTTKLSIFRQVQIIVGILVLLATLLGFSGQTWGFAVAGLFGAALTFAGISGWCGLAILLSKAPWNK